MKLKQLSQAIALGTAVCVMQSAYAQDEAPATETSNFQAELEALKAQVAELEQKQQATASEALSVSDVTDNVTFNGFYSVGFSQMSEDGYVYQDGQSGDTSTKPNTLVGLQMNANLYKGGEFVTQLIAKGYDEGETDFAPQVEWLYWKHDFGAGFDVQAGRIRFPLFMESGNYYVGYSYPWIKAPSEIYSVLDLSNIDGATINYNTTFGDWNLGAQLVWGNGDYSWSEGEVSLNDIAGLVLATGTDDLTIRVAYMQAEQQWNVQAGGAPDPILFGDDIEYITEAIKYDNGTIYASAEAIQVKADKGTLAENNNWNATFGWRLGSFMPYVGYTDSKVDNGEEISANLVAAGIDQFGADSAQRVLNQTQTTLTAGVRWDFAAKTSVKFQVQKLGGFDGTIGNFSNGAAGAPDVTVTPVPMAPPVVTVAWPEGDVLPFDDVYIYEIAIQGVF